MQQELWRTSLGPSQDSLSRRSSFHLALWACVTTPPDIHTSSESVSFFTLVNGKRLGCTSYNFSH